MKINDEGMGIGRIIPLLLHITTINSSNAILILEEPEANLHPALQSKLADMLVDAKNKFNIEFVVETHSEYIIRRLQLLIAKKTDEVSTDDVQIYYFHNPNNIPEGEDAVYPINIMEDGTLTKNFGAGFFDEASNLSLALFNHNNN